MTQATRKHHRVLVVGGGFAGLQAVRGLSRTPVEVTLVDRQNYHLFQPLVYQVATGALSSAEIAIPLRAVVKRQRNVNVLLGQVTGFDLKARQVVIADLPDHSGPRHLDYDTLVVAAGSHYSYFGHEEWQAHAPELKSIGGALEIRSRILTAFEAAALEKDEQRRRSWLTFFVVGAGPTGVEMAGQIAELARDTLRQDFRSLDTSRARVLLLDMSSRVLPTFPEKLSGRALRALEGLGVEPMLDSTVVDITAQSLEIRDATGRLSRISGRTAIWAAGVAASDLAADLAEQSGAELDSAGRVPVDPTLALDDHPEVLVLGDMALVHETDGSPHPLPGLAPVAMQQGRYAATAIAERLRGNEPGAFHYKDKGNLATIGRLKAVADIRGIHISGLPAWLAWLSIHIYFLIGFQNRLFVFLRWTESFLTRGRGARVIEERTGETKPDEVS